MKLCGYISPKNKKGTAGEGYPRIEIFRDCPKISMKYPVIPDCTHPDFNIYLLMMGFPSFLTIKKSIN